MGTSNPRIIPLDIDSQRPPHPFRAVGYRTVAVILALASALLLPACGSLSAGTLPAGVSITISPKPASVPVNGTVVFTATTTESGAVSWSLYCGAVGGTLSSTTGTTVTYTAPATPPIYTAPCSGGEGNGIVTLQATAGPVSAPQFTVASFPITAPTVAIGLAPTTATVALGGTEQFVGYAVGSVNNGLTWQVNGITGGSATTGTITNAVTPYYQGGLYTAPTVLPMTGNTVTITMISQADPTKTQTAIVTLQ
jgi:hypothetical protein